MLQANSPLCCRTTCSSWMRSRFSASATSSRSASPRVPTVEKDCSRWSSPKSWQAASISRLCVGAFLGVEAPPGGVDLQERVLDEVPVGHVGHEHRAVPSRADMRIALVSPYSWTYPGGVTGHIEALSAELRRAGHDVSVLAPVDPPDRLSARLHRGARPQDRELPEWLVPLGRTFGFPANGAVSNLSLTPYAVSRLRTELATGGYDVVHLHEPIAPVACVGRALAADLPLVGTFHCYSANRRHEQPRQRRRRLAAAQPAARAHRGVRGGRLDRAALLRRALPRHPQRRARRAASRARSRARAPGRSAAARLRRPGGRAQGPAGAAARLRGAARAPARAAGDRRRDAGGGRRRAARRPRRARARQGLRRAQAPGAARGRPPRARRRSAASRSGWCSRRRSPRARRSSRRTSPATPTS